MIIKVLATQWGSEAWSADQFLDYTQKNGYNGIEINMPEDEVYIDDFQKKIEEIRKNQDFAFVGQCVLGFKKETFQEHLERYTIRLRNLMALNPDFINVQTGSDYFTFDQNCTILESAMDLSSKSGIPVYHETHRGKFSFHSLKTLDYIEKLPELSLTADLSHWCNVSESLLEGQEEILEKIFPHVKHIHARIGFAEAPQTNHFAAPEWQETTQKFITWWRRILEVNKDQKQFTFLTEFGPPPYLPCLPFSNVPVANQWELNIMMKDLLNKEYMPT